MQTLGRQCGPFPPGGVLQKDAQQLGAVNPLFKGRAAVAAAAPASGSGSAPYTLWQRVADGGDVWFVHAETGESVWELPPGGVLMNEKTR